MGGRISDVQTHRPAEPSVEQSDQVYILGLPQGERVADGEPLRDSCPLISTCPSPVTLPAGLAWDGSRLWLGLAEEDNVLRIHPITCEVDHMILAPGSHIGGVAWDPVAGTLWCLMEQQGRIYELSPVDGTVLSEFPSPSFDGAGLAHDGTFLWHADYEHDMLYKLDPSDGTILEGFPTPGSIPSGVAWNGDSVILADASTDSVYVIDPSDGSVISGCPSPDNHSWGLASTQGNLLGIPNSIWSSGLDTDTLYSLDAAGTSAIGEGASTRDRLGVSLHANVPNPFNPRTTLRFSLAAGGSTDLAVYDLAGCRVTTLISETVPAGLHQVVWDGTDRDGRPLSSGVFLAILRSQGQTAMRKVILLR